MRNRLKLPNLSIDSDRKDRSLEARKKVKTLSKYKKGDYPSSNKAVKLKKWRDGWFGK